MAANRKINNEIYRVPQLMKLLGICRDKAYKLMQSKSFPSFKIGSTYFVTKDALETWLYTYAHREFVL